MRHLIAPTRIEDKKCSDMKGHCSSVKLAHWEMVGAKTPLRVTRISREAARMHSRSGPHPDVLTTASTLAANQATSQCLAR